MLSTDLAIVRTTRSHRAAVHGKSTSTKTSGWPIDLSRPGLLGKYCRIEPALPDPRRNNVKI
jgi:hypothetical protein